MTEKKKFPFSVILSQTNNWFLKRTSGQCRKKEDILLSVFPSQNITHENGCFKTQTRNWKWSRDTRFWAENLTCIYIKQPQTFKYLFWTKCQEKRNSLFRSSCRKQIFVLDTMTEKGNFFFPDIVSETNISAKTHNPFSGMWYKTKICCFILLTN